MSSFSLFDKRIVKKVDFRAEALDLGRPILVLLILRIFSSRVFHLFFCVCYTASS